MNLKSLINKRNKNLKEFDENGILNVETTNIYNDIISSIGKKLIGIDIKTNTVKTLKDEVKFSSFNSDLDDVSEGNTNKHFTSDNQTKLSGIEENADVTANNANDIIKIGSFAPASPNFGWIWIDTSDSNYYIVKRYNGLAWIQCASNGAKLGEDLLDEAGTTVLGESELRNSNITTSDLSGKIDDSTISGTLSQNKITDLSTDLNNKVDISTTVNGQALVSNVSLDADDIDDSSTTNKFATTSELSQISTNQSNISTNSSNISTIESETKDNTVNLIENPFFRDESHIGWTNPNDGTYNNIVSSFIPYTSEFTGRGCGISGGTVTLSSTATEFTDLFSDSNIMLDDGIYIKFSGDPTSALEDRVFQITSYNGTSKKLYFDTNESLTINEYEKFYVGFFSDASTMCIKLEGAQYDGSGDPDLSKAPYSNPIPIPNKFSNNLSFQCNAFCLDTSTSNARLYIYYFLKDKSGNLISTFYSVTDTGMYGARELMWVKLRDTFTISGFSNIPDDETIYLHICLFNSLGNGQCYATGFQLNFGDAVYPDIKDSPLSSTNYTNSLNTAFGNANAVNNIREGKKPDGKFPSPASSYYSITLKYDYTTGISETNFDIRNSDLEALIPSVLDLGSNDKITCVQYNVQKHNTGDIYDSVDQNKDVKIQYDSSGTTYNEEYFDRLKIANCSVSTDYRIIVSCQIQTLTPV